MSGTTVSAQDQELIESMALHCECELHPSRMCFICDGPVGLERAAKILRAQREAAVTASTERGESDV